MLTPKFADFGKNGDLYESFNAVIAKNEITYTQFLNDLIKNAIIYMQIVNPKREDYDNRKEYFVIVQSLNCINNYFNVVQVRIAVLALFEAKQRGIIDFLMLKSAILYLENFHFAYNAVLSSRPNRLEKIYSTFAIELRKTTQKNDAQNIIQKKLIIPLDALFPKFDEFYKKFIELSYSKSEKPSNVKTKYAVNKLNGYFSNKEIFFDDGSVEHIVSETEGENALNIGNLVLLEQVLNGEAGHKCYIDKIHIYQKSCYIWVKKFIENYPQWNESMIKERAKKLARIYYEDILKRDIEQS